MSHSSKVGSRKSHEIPFKDWAIKLSAKAEKELKKLARHPESAVKDVGTFIGSVFEHAKLTPPPVVLNPSVPPPAVPGE